MRATLVLGAILVALLGAGEVLQASMARASGAEMIGDPACGTRPEMARAEK